MEACRIGNVIIERSIYGDMIFAKMLMESCDMTAAEYDLKILDLGCGPGIVIRFLLEIDDNYCVDAIDLSAEMLNLAQYYAPKANFFMEDIRNLDKINKKYDAIIASFIIVHLTGENVSKNTYRAN